MERYCRYEKNGSVYYGRVEEKGIFTLECEPWFEGKETGLIVPLTEVNLLHPCDPKVIIGLGGAYKEAWENKNPPGSVRWFIKPPGAAASWNDEIILPSSLDEAKVEVELVIVIGKRVKDADQDESRDAIFGYTIGNDLVGTVDSYYRMTDESDGYDENLLPLGLKICDRFAPFGPYIYKNIDWRDRKRILKIINKEGDQRVVYENSTSGLIYLPEKIVSDLSRVLTLLPGDIVMTGTTQSFPVYPGEIVEASIEGMGRLINRIVGSANNKL